MTSPNKAKGDRFELELTRYLAEVHGRQVRRPHQEGYEDVGDIHLSPFVIQAKNYRSVTEALNVGLAGAAVQAVRAEEPYGVVAVKRRGKSAEHAYIAMTAATFRDLVRRLAVAEAP
ncbi:hypothetical protein ACFCV3_41955 [Kribbella sp. NPDC056345]|uniref:hypothetical protein n=1 Tax=Kribbella sp. NPDC056345 TaxID=3345789 RepID=UPI0035E0E40C